MLMFFMEIRVMLLSFWLGPAEQLPRREGVLAALENQGGKFLCTGEHRCHPCHCLQAESRSSLDLVPRA